ncbi:glycosyltransferase family 2 protein [Pedobacter sp.]|jgi:glycosyltransferase involved in cell wall biosynthesis|uniref:glycosyltransferase family 2 protein n=1 Tax=Pedobacter sp. TaxID=1411316 RepID=UPI002BA54CE2|nr:glycosyltransferase family 2 protein [Pedobacter sp.]HWW37995.1 glycosyltransferase family 2 protein [Pedobacter sp.]
MKVSIVSVVLNCRDYIADCILSVIGQDYSEIEYIVIDGGSTDGTLDVIQLYRDHIHVFVTQKDQGFYDGLNKGIALATGDVIGILNADDMIAEPGTISRVVRRFATTLCGGVYGNLEYTERKDTGRIVRSWRPGDFSLEKLKRGWMPPHPTIYLNKELYGRCGNYSMNFGTSADYEFILRLFSAYGTSMVYIDHLMVKMRKGGMSNAGMKPFLLACIYDYRSLVLHRFRWPLLVTICKKLRKIEQFFY